MPAPHRANITDIHARLDDHEEQLKEHSARLAKYDAIITRLDILVDTLTKYIEHVEDRVDHVAERAEEAIDGQTVLKERNEGANRWATIGIALASSLVVGILMFLLGYALH